MPKYIEHLFLNFLWGLTAKTIWLNVYELNDKKIDHRLHGEGQLFDHFGVNKDMIQYTKHIEWRIDDKNYQSFINLKPKESIKSQIYNHEYDNEQMSIYFKCYAKFSRESPNTALFLYVDKFPHDIIGIGIEFDVLCEKRVNYRQFMTLQWLSKDNQMCGFQTFPFNDLKDDNSITWKIAVKIIGIRKIAYDQISVDQNTRDDAFHLTIIETSKGYNGAPVISKYRSLPVPFVVGPDPVCCSKLPTQLSHSLYCCLIYTTLGRGRNG